MANISFIWLPVSDIETSFYFYTNILGLKEIRSVEDGEKKFVFLENREESVTVVLMYDGSIELQPAFPKSIISWEVNNLQSVHDVFEKKGVVFENGIEDFDGMRIANFKDPDGHLFQLIEK